MEADQDEARCARVVSEDEFRARLLDVGKAIAQMARKMEALSSLGETLNGAIGLFDDDRLRGILTDPRGRSTAEAAPPACPDADRGFRSDK